MTTTVDGWTTILGSLLRQFSCAWPRRACWVMAAALLLPFMSDAVGAPAPVPLATGLNNPFPLAVDGGYVYWAELNGSTASLRRIPNAGGAPANLTTFTAFLDPYNIYRGIDSVVFTASNMYFGWGSYDGYRIEEATKTGASRRVVVPNFTGGNLLGVINGYVYYLQNFCCITKVPVDGSTGPQTVLTGNWVRSAAYDSGAIYFVEYFSRNVYRFDVATNTRTPLITGNAVQGGVVIDANNVYYSDGTRILAVPKQGGSVSTLYTGSSVSARVSDGGILYFTEDGNLKAIPLTGGAATLTLPGASVVGMVQDPNALYWADASAGNGAGVIYRLQKDLIQGALLSSPLPVGLPATQSLHPPSKLSLYQPVFDRSKPTIVISHGWNPLNSSELPFWVNRMALAVNNRANVFLWNWLDKAKSFAGFLNPNCGPNQLIDPLVAISCGVVPFGNVENAGKDLAEALDKSLCVLDPGCGSGVMTYRQPVHLVGHSLGTGVIAYAAKNMQLYKVNIDHLTFLDSAYLTLPPADTTLADLKGRSPNPVFIDHYKSLVQLPSIWSLNPQVSNTNAYLLSPLIPIGTDCRSGSIQVDLALAHGYPGWWYTSSYEDFGCATLISDLTIPPSPPQYGTALSGERNGSGIRSGTAFIYASLDPFQKWRLLAVSHIPQAVQGAATYAVGQVVDLTQKMLDTIQTAAVKTGTKVTVLWIKAFNTAQSAGEWAVDKANNAFWVIKNPGAAAINGAIRLVLNSNATVHSSVFIPPTATSMRFSFEFIEAHPGTALEVFLNDTLVYITRGDDMLGKGQQISDWLEIAPFAGKQVTMAFRLGNPVEGNRGTVDLDDIVIANVIAAGGPFALAKAPTTARANSVITLDGTGSIDPEPGPQQLTFAWSQLQGSAVQIVNGQSARPSFVGTTPGAYSFSLIVNDGQAASVPSFVTVVVPRLGDIDLNGDVDLNDLAKINAALNTKASGPNDLRDLDGDGMITALDARKLVTLCTRARCATQ